MNLMFDGCLSLSSLSNIEKWNTKKVKNMSYMFSGCSSLSSLSNIDNWEISAKTNKVNMFFDCNKNIIIPSKFMD